MNQLERIIILLGAVMDRYDPEYDINPGSPPVTANEYKLTICTLALAEELINVKKELDQLKGE